MIVGYMDICDSRG